ncbi:MAG: hypothetical protein M3O07_06045, partial [Pseudomonadota bacterium]|nr:hypothetical protein [Pseudomonadota bacterium]
MITIRKAFAGLATALYCGFATAAAVETPAPVDQPTFVYPQERVFGAHKAVLHAPQIESWSDFTQFNGVMAIEFFPDAGTKALLGTVTLSGKTEVDLAERLVYVTDTQIDKVSLKAEKAETYEAALRAGVRKGRLEVPLDIFLLSLDDAILDRPPPAGFTKTAPDIIVSRTPAIVLFINGQPVLTDLPETGLKLVVNANWPLVTDATSSVYYLLDREVWLTAPKLAGPWTATRKLPKGLKDLDKKGDHALIAAAVPAPKTKQVASTVHQRETPTEILVIEGEPKLEEIPGAAGLSYVTNSESALFKSGAKWYFPVAGRWFSTADPFQGPWTFVESLPEAFTSIPANHKVAYVRSSVRGTLESRVAALESLLPKRKSVTMETKPAIQVSYAGDPKFEPIESTSVSRAVNTGYDVIQFKDGYYLCYAGVWYNAVAPIGPWTVAKHVPKEIYAIPPSSPSYHVTQVTVVESTPTVIVYEQTPSYSSNVYVVYGVPWYGTGYYYHPYAYGYYYYPYPIAYGHGNYYNPATGGYGSRSVWYGPYGGYSYTNGYNPRTGRYGYVETAWDGDEWGSYSEKYNPRTGVATETSRHYNEDSNKSKMERRVERGDEWIETERKTDFDKGTSTTERETSRGGSSEITHTRDDAGNRTTSGSIESGDGRTATIEGSGRGGQGSSVITGSEGGSATIDRDGRNTRTDFETADGGMGTSIKNDGNRTTVAEGANGDLYAGRNGNVFKKTDNGWQSYDRDNGNWNQVPERPNANPRPTQQTRETGRLGSSASVYGPSDYSRQSSSRITQGGGSRDFSQLNRDAAA